MMTKVITMPKVRCLVTTALICLTASASGFAGERTPLKEKFPKAGEVIPLIEGFPLLKNLLEVNEPWKVDALKLKYQIFPREMKLAFGTRENPALFIGRRYSHDWRKISWKDAYENDLADWPGLKVWDQWSYETDYYVLKLAKPFIRLHLDTPLLASADKMKLLFPEQPQSARKDIPAKMDKVVEALGPYGAKKLPIKHPRIRQYILPGGTMMTFSDFTIHEWAGEWLCDEVRIKIDFEPVEPPKGREQLPHLLPWREDDRQQKACDLPPSIMGYLRQQQSGLDSSGAAKSTPTKGEAAPRKWSDVADGFASLDGMGQNGTTGGAGGKTVTVTNQVELVRYARAIEPYIIRVKGAIKLTPKPNPITRYERLTPKEIHVASDKTIIGVGKTGEVVNGGFFLGPDVHNVIIRNLTIRDTFLKGDWGGMRQDDDGLQMDTAHHVWVDHCHFTRHGDGCLDSRLGTTYVTVSWCIFSNHNKTFGIGWDKDVRGQMTIHHNWFRNTSCRNPCTEQVIRAHLYNNYLQNVGTRGHWSRSGTNMILQNTLFENVNNPHRVAGCHDGRCKNICALVATGNIYRNTRGRRETRGRVYFDPSKFYAYTLDEAKDLPGILAKYAGPQENIGQ